ncbi:sulfotransferase family protein [Marinobacter sp.]|uniref:sulfotransferase family protein n=1 Tax=Marinobacter sp. TaxID=50741 RepID=UPI0034A179C5
MNNFFQKITRNRLTIPFTPFYRRYPYRSGISINSADARGCIDTRLGFFCNRIPKAANSTIVENLARLSFGEDVPSKLAKKRFTVPSQLSRSEVDKVDIMFRFAVVRNPFTRTLSAYLDKVERRDRNAQRESNFFDFLQGLANGKLYSNAHWAPQHSLLLLPFDDFDFFGKVESLDSDLNHIRAKISGRPGAESIKTFKANATGAGKKLQEYYNEDTVGMVQELFHKDFELFEYSRELPA